MNITMSDVQPGHDEPAAGDAVEPLILDLLEWIGPDGRPYSEVIEPWRTSCPRLPVWENANARGYLARVHASGGEALIKVSQAGAAHLQARRGRLLSQNQPSPQEQSMQTSPESIQAQVQWDVSQYLRFGGERLRPALDLMLHLPTQNPARILDLGCGTGNLTALLQQRWPRAEVLGVDGSDDMLAKARLNVPQARFVAADLNHWVPEHKLDLIYTNATLQWLPDHAQLFPRLLSFLNPGGCLAVQMPVMHDAPLRRAQVELARSPAYADVLGEVSERRNVLEVGRYYDLLRPRVATLDIWQTSYLHILTGADPVLEWASGSSLRPYLEKLEGDQLQAFRTEYARRMQQAYPPSADGSTLLPFQRMFIVASLPG